MLTAPFWSAGERRRAANSNRAGMAGPITGDGLGDILLCQLLFSSSYAPAWHWRALGERVSGRFRNGFCNVVGAWFRDPGRASPREAHHRGIFLQHGLNFLGHFPSLKPARGSAPEIRSGPVVQFHRRDKDATPRHVGEHPTPANRCEDRRISCPSTSSEL